MDLLHAISLGIVQGITEWLPISSSGHLVILKEISGITAPISFDLALHFGTIVAVCIYFRRELFEIIRSILKFETKSEPFRTALLLVVASAPAAVAGYFLNDLFESLFNSLFAVGLGLLVTASMLSLSRARKGNRRVDFLRALVIGIFQALAIAPGISRSGMTISSAILTGVEKASAFKFSFLMSIPVIIGAFFYELSGSQIASFSLEYLAGFLTSALVGYASIATMRRIVLYDRLPLFSVYCVFLGIALIAYQLL